MWLVLDGTPLSNTLLDSNNQATLRAAFPDWNPSEMRLFTDSTNPSLRYRSVPDKVLQEAAVLYTMSHKNLVDMINFTGGGLQFELDPVNGFGNLLSKGGVDIDPSPSGHVWVELGMRMFFPRSSVASVLKVSRAKKDSKATMSQKFWSGVSERLKTAELKASSPAAVTIASSAAAAASSPIAKA